MKNIFIIGAGVVGAMVARRCHSLGYNVTVLDNFKTSHESASKLVCGVWRDTWYKDTTQYKEALTALKELGVSFLHIDSYINTKYGDTIKKSMQKSYQVDILSDLTLYENPELFCNEVINGEVIKITSYNGKTEISYKDITSKKKLSITLSDTTVYVCAGYKTPELLNIPLSNYTYTHGIATIHKHTIRTKDKPSYINDNGKQYTYIFNVQPHKNVVVRDTIINGNRRLLVRYPWESKGEKEDTEKYNSFVGYFNTFSTIIPNYDEYEMKYGTRLHSKSDEYVIKINDNLIGICGTGKDTVLLSALIVKELIK